jgi:hypothetical protein
MKLTINRGLSYCQTEGVSTTLEEAIAAGSLRVLQLA